MNVSGNRHTREAKIKVVISTTTGRGAEIVVVRNTV